LLEGVTKTGSFQSKTFNMKFNENNQKTHLKVPEWAKQIIWYQIFPERFRKGYSHNNPTLSYFSKKNIKDWEITPFGKEWFHRSKWESEISDKFYHTVNYRRYGGDFKGILDSIQYLKKLGITGIYLNPVFMAPSNHKYDASVLHHIDPYFGSDPQGDFKIINKEISPENPAEWQWTKADIEFLELIEVFHENGIKVIIDGVFNHSGRDFFAFKDIIKNKKNSKYLDWYTIKRWQKNNKDGFIYKSWLGHKNLPEFAREENDFNKPVKKYIFDIVSRWMNPGQGYSGIDGWRLDAVDCINHGFLNNLAKHIINEKKDALIIGEIWHIHPEYILNNEMHAFMNYPFCYNAVDLLLNKKGIDYYIKKQINLLSSYPYNNTLVMQNLYSSHDTARLNNIILNAGMDLSLTDHFQKTKLQFSHKYKIGRIGRNLEKIRKLLLVIQFISPGAPMIYYGDEVGMEGANDPDCRKPMLWEDIEYEDEIKHPIFGVKKQEENTINYELFEFYQKIIKIRKKYKALNYGEFEYKKINDNILKIKRFLEDEFVITYVNISNVLEEFEDSRNFYKIKPCSAKIIDNHGVYYDI